jgi:hypothetical protein
VVRYVRGRSHEGGSDADGGMYVQSRALDMCGERVTGGRYLTAVSGGTELTRNKICFPEI